jgi:hypothetical protein
MMKTHKQHGGSEMMVVYVTDNCGPYLVKY